jgi:DNA-directed RNA polymerase specialized sigma24 family protein
MVQSETVVDNLRSYWIVASVNVGRDIMKHHWHSKRQFVPVDGGVSQDTSRYAYPDLAERARARTLLENTANIADTPLGRLLRQEVADEVAAFVSRLDTSIREPLVLKDVEDLTHEEIALKIGISVGACKMRVMRARQLLRDWIDDERPDIMTTEFGG